MNRLARAFIASGIVGVIGLIICLSPARKPLEEGMGLGLLFKLRGPRPAPDGAVIVAIDRASADQLRLPFNSYKWPRDLHARIIDRLYREDPAVIVFDILFHEAGIPEHDDLLIRAMHASRNVILAAYLRLDTAPLVDKSGAQYGTLKMERVIPPIPALETASLASVPFPLPKIPVRLNSYWAFKRGAGDLPTLPVVAFKAYAWQVYTRFENLAKTIGFGTQAPVLTDWQTLVSQRKLKEITVAYRTFFDQHPDAAARMLAAIEVTPSTLLTTSDRRLLTNLVYMYQPPALRYLNFYGPPGTIPTVSYHRLLESTPGDNYAPPLPDMRGKAVFVGAAGLRPQEQKDGFYTIFSRMDGLDISGVEIAATAFANILENTRVHHLTLAGELAVILGWGAILGFVGLWFSGKTAYTATTLLSLTYAIVIYQQFAAAGRWLPLIIPLGVQMPFTVVFSLIWRYTTASREGRNIRTAFENYLPDDVVAQVAQGKENIRHQRLVYCICLFTDAQNYTKVAEKVAPQELGHFVNRYLQVLFEPVRYREGIISDIKGDSILAIWSADSPEPALRRKACLAALDMDYAVARFNAREKENDRELPTRIGVHAGDLLLGNLGEDFFHLEYRPVGDVVNTAQRLDNLNKQLGTRILASEDVLDQIEDIFFRPLGRFRLAGKEKPVGVCELIGRPNEVGQAQRKLCRRFARALAVFHSRAFEEAAELFHGLSVNGVTDGPALFYADKCQEYIDQPPPSDWDGTVSLEVK